MDITTIPYRAEADGNCLYNAVSLALFGTESYSDELRARAAIFLHDNASEFCTVEGYMRLTGIEIAMPALEFIIDSSLERDGQTEHIESIKKRAKLVVKRGVFSSILEIIAVSNVLHVAIDVIYPCKINKFTKPELFSGKYVPKDSSASITISWTHTSDKDMESGRWMPNHFVPCSDSVGLKVNSSQYKIIGYLLFLHTFVYQKYNRA